MKRWFAALLCALLFCPAAALAGDDSDPLRDLGVAPAIQGTRFADMQHHWNIYCDEPAGIAAAVFWDDAESVLVQFAREGNAWHITESGPGPLCQGTSCPMLVSGTGDNQLAGLLTLHHTPTSYSSEQFFFARHGDQWVFDHAVLQTPTQDIDNPTGDIYNSPQRIAYVTWENGELIHTWYTADYYGQLPDQPKVTEPGGGYWIPSDVAPERYPCPQQPTLATFNVDTFPRDAYSAALRAGQWSNCTWKKGQRDPRATYCAVNNPNPKDRLNLRKEASTKAESRGRYYNGMVFRVLEVQPDGWVRVTAGTNNLGGFLRQEYLAFGDDIDQVENVMPRYTMPKGAWSLLFLPFDESNVKADMKGGEEIQVLGIVSGWWHIDCGGQRGYIRELEALE